MNQQDEREKLLPCPFCGSKNIDAKGWASTDRSGPACDDCGGSADTVELWNSRPAQGVPKPFGEVLDEMDHQAKYQPATVDPKREQELRIQALGAALSRRDWPATERAYEAIRDKFSASAVSSTEREADHG